MKGKILYFDEISNTGKISGYDGNRYDFTNNDWKSNGSPIQNSEVDFEIQENSAKDIFCLSPQKNKQVANITETIGGLGILCFLIPLLGLILYIVWKEPKPIKSKGAGKAALWGIIITFVFYFIIGIIGAFASV